MNRLIKKRTREDIFRRIVITLLIVVLLGFACYKLLELIPNGTSPKKTPPISTIEYTEDGNIRDLATNFEIDNKSDKEYSYYNTAVNIDETNRLVSYNTGNNEIEFDSNYVADLLVDAVRYDGKQILEKTYLSGDMKADIVDYEYFSVVYDYDGSGSIKTMTVDGDKYEVDQNGRMEADSRNSSSLVAARLNANDDAENNNIDNAVAVKLNGNKIYEYVTDDKSRITYEADYENSLAYGYTYVGNTLTEIKYYRIFDGIAFNYETIDVSANLSFDFSNCQFGYGYNNAKYITQLKSANKTTYFSYLNDKLTVQVTDDIMTEYILDGEIKYSGLVYDDEMYFYGYDTLGRINSILDEYGYEVVRYYFTATGELYDITGEYANTLGKANSILFDGSGVYDHSKGVYYTANGIYDPKTARVLNYANNTVTPRTNTVQTADDYLLKSPVNKHTVIHDRVMQIVSEYFSNENVEVGYGLYVENSYGDKTGLVDIYTLPYEIAPFSCGNLLNGNQVYDVVYNTETQLNNAKAKMSELIDKDSDKTVNYFASYKPLDGTMNISGEFVFLGSLIRYNTIEHGIILYDVLDNVSKNYSGNTNVYDYDNSKYLLFNKPDYDIEMFKGVRLIPGINQEYYDNVQEQLDIARINAQLTIEQINKYEDPAIFNTNDQKNIWDEVEIPEGQTLVFDEKGEPHFKPLPESSSGRFWRTVALGAAIFATIVVTTVVTIATVGCGTPLAVGICVGVGIGLYSGFVIGAVAGAAFEVGSALVNGDEIDLTKVCTPSLEVAVDCAVVGGVTGAIAGAGAALGAFGGCFVAGTEVATNNGDVAIENVQVGDKVLARDDKTGKVEEKEVTDTFVEQAGEIVKLTVDGEVIEATTGHPFYAEHRGYIAAAQLRAGDILVDVNGERKVVEKVQHEILEKPVKVYNLEVEDDHNFFVGGTGVLVHNNCGAALKPLIIGAYVAATAAYMVLTGLLLDQVINLIAEGVLNWPGILIRKSADESDIEITREIDTVIERIKDDPPKKEKRIYNFAFIFPNAPKMTVIYPSLSLTEAVFLTLLIHNFEAMSVNGYPDISNVLSEIIINIAKEIRTYLKEEELEVIGIYTKNRGDARQLATEVFVAAGDYSMDTPRKELDKIENHFDPNEPWQVHYNHYHVDFYKKKSLPFEKKFHFWFGSRVTKVDGNTVEE